MPQTAATGSPTSQPVQRFERRAQAFRRSDTSSVMYILSGVPVDPPVLNSRSESPADAPAKHVRRGGANVTFRELREPAQIGGRLNRRRCNAGFGKPPGIEGGLGGRDGNQLPQAFGLPLLQLGQRQILRSLEQMPFPQARRRRIERPRWLDDIATQPRTDTMECRRS